MATFTVKIDTDSAAFGDETGIEIAIILRGIADDVEGSMPGPRPVTSRRLCATPRATRSANTCSRNRSASISATLPICFGLCCPREAPYGAPRGVGGQLQRRRSRTCPRAFSGRAHV